ncbi:MAG TPA: hypothetical protein VMG12_04165, partial [Polyangiaceae bacterium]|nr:hypothetical protein [Polyangiaceae bacterium]
MNALTTLRTWCRHSLTPALALRTFTAVIGVKPNQHEALAALLATLDGRMTESPAAPQPSDYATVPGLHNLRWILFTPTERANEEALDAPRALILNLAFDGELDDILAELLLPASDGGSTVRDDMLAVLRRCEGFDGAEEPAAYLRQREVPSGFVFRDIGPFDAQGGAGGDAVSTRLWPQRDSSDTADASLAELKDAHARLEQFVDFHANNPPPAHRYGAAALARRFLDTFDDAPSLLPLHPLEVRQREEARWIRLASELMQRKQRRVARQMRDGLVRRGAHAKGHGLVRATFKVCMPQSSSDARYHVGIFERPGETFDAILRPSNGADAINHDRKFDLRGLAISLDVPTQRGEWLGVPGRQDFVLADQPVLFASNIQSFVRLLAVVEQRDVGRQLWHGARFLLQPGALKQAQIALRGALGRIGHPLKPVFHSAVPYQLGRDYIVKYSAEPSAGSQIEPASSMRSHDFLSAALESSLPTGMTLDFFVYALPIDMDRAVLQQAVEDATVDFRKLGAKKVKLATIEIEAQADG